MNRPDIQLKKERDFSDVFNASFAFLTSEFSRLFRTVVLYAGVPIIIAVVMSTFYTQNVFASVFQTIETGSASEFFDPWMVFLSGVAGFIAQIFIAGLLPAYMGEYLDKGQSGVVPVEVWQRFLAHFPAIVGYSLLSGLIIAVGFMFLVLPGIYLFVPMSFILFVKVVENKDFSSTFSRCFQLVSNNWWITLLILILTYLIIMIISGLFSMPAVIVGIIQGILVGSGQHGAGDSTSLAFVITTIVSGIGKYLLYPVLYIVIGFQYFSLREQKDRDHLMAKVSEINEEE